MSRTRAQAEGPLQAHTIAVNEVGVAFVRAAREHGDECGPDSWRHEIAHPISPRRGRRPAELVIADALLTYLQGRRTAALALHQRFDRARPRDRPPGRAARQQDHPLHAAPPLHAHRRQQAAEPLWRGYYRSWPHLLIVLADQPRAGCASASAAHPRAARHPTQRRAAVGRSRVLRARSTTSPAHGPFAPIFITAEQPEQPVDWLGQPQAEKVNDGFRTITATPGRKRVGHRRRARSRRSQCGAQAGSGPAPPICRSRYGPALSARASGSAMDRYLPESNRHPAKMLPEIARRAIAAYSEPGDLVLDPMCGIGDHARRGDPPGPPRDRRGAGRAVGRARRRERRARPRARSGRPGAGAAG